MNPGRTNIENGHLRLWIAKLGDSPVAARWNEELREELASYGAAELSYQQYRLSKRVISLCLSTTVGLAIAVLGFRVLQPLFIDSAIAQPTVAFLLCDVFLTAAIIAGGTEGTPRLTSAVMGVMDQAPRPRGLG